MLFSAPGLMRQDSTWMGTGSGVCKSNRHLHLQSPHGSLAKGLAGLAMSGGRSEFPVVPLEATLVKAVLAWAAGSAQSVEVKGSYDGWGPARRLQKQPDGSWAIAAYLSPGVYQVNNPLPILSGTACMQAGRTLQGRLHPASACSE